MIFLPFFEAINNNNSSNPIPIIDSNNLLSTTLPSTSASLTIQSTIGCPPPISLLATSLHLTSSSGFLFN